MPPKKRQLALPEKVGKIRQYLTDNFGDLPDDVDSLKNGHLLFIYIMNYKSIGKIVKTVVEKFNCSLTNSQVRPILTRANKITDVSSDKGMKKYMELCCEAYTAFKRQPMETVSSTPVASSSCQKELKLDEISPKKPSPVTPTVCSSSRINLTPRRLRKRLDNLSVSHSTLKESYQRRLTQLKSQINLPRSQKLKYLKQDINRLKLKLTIKDQKIRTIKAKTHNALVQKLEKSRKELYKARHNLQRIKEFKASSSCSGCVASAKKIELLTDKLAEKNKSIESIENQKLVLEEAIDTGEADKDSGFLKEGRTYSMDMRMFVYDSIVNHVPMHNIPILIQQFAKRSGILVEKIPHRNTVEMMARELGIVSDFQAAEMVLEGKDITMGFDATTQDGIHVNSVHVTSKETCHVLALDQLAGGTAEDYELHIAATFDHISNVYCTLYDLDFYETRKKIIKNISNTITDRAAVNYATIQRLENAWGKKFNQLHCHLHPLDTIASTIRTSLKAIEPRDLNKKLFGTDCIASQLVLGINKLRYKDGRGDPKGFTAALRDAGLPKGLIPRYRGNRLHIMFLICGRLVEHNKFFTKFFEEGLVSCGGLQTAIAHDFKDPITKMELQVLGLVGILLSGPWMTRFYTPAAASSINHIDAIEEVKNVLAEVKNLLLKPEQTLTATKDLFGRDMKSDGMVFQLKQTPADLTIFKAMMTACLTAIVKVLEKQYNRYFSLNITEVLKKETESARPNNIDAEQVMGMFSALKNHAPNATICYISCKIRAQKNGAVNYLDGLPVEKREKLISLAISMGRKTRLVKRKKSEETKKEICQRLAIKRQKKLTAERRKIEAKLRKPVLDLSTEFPEMDDETMERTKDILSGKIIGQNICHIWFDAETLKRTLYFGKVEKFLKRGGGVYVIGYWGEEESYDDDAEDFDIKKSALAADFICGDVTLP